MIDSLTRTDSTLWPLAPAPDRHIVALSGGADSTCMAVLLRERHPETDFAFVCTPTGRELPAMQDHWTRLSEVLGAEIHHLTPPRAFDDLVQLNHKLPNWRMRWCTLDLKLVPYERVLRALAPAISYVGLRADEPERVGGIYSHIPGIEMRFPLREWGMTRADVLRELAARDITIPRRTDCDGCFFQTLYEWWLLWREHPDRWAELEAMEEATGHTLRSPGRDTWPAALRDLRAEFERGRVPKQRRELLKEGQCRVCTL